jgi:hypothetical protein
MSIIKHDNVNLITLKGTPEEMAKQHGYLLKNEIQSCALQKLARKNQFLIKQSGGILGNSLINKLAINLYNNLLIPIMTLSLPSEEKRKLQALAKAAEIPFQILLRAFYQADGLMLLSRISLMNYLFIRFPKSQLPGCSSAVVSGKLTEKNELLVMRNQDYPVVGTWENLTTVAMCYPSGENKIPYMFVTSAGLHTGGLTSMNKAGLTVAVHAHFGKKVNIAGAPIFHLAEKIISRCSTIDQADEIIKLSQVHANWTIVVSSAKENTAAAFEITPGGFAKRPMTDGSLTHTNFFQTKHLNQDEALISGARHDDDNARILQMNRLIKENIGKITTKDMIGICGNHEDPYSKSPKVFGNTISVMTTVKSVVMEPATFTLNISNRKKSPVGLGDFLKITEESFRGGEIQKISNPNIYSKEFLKTIDIYRESYIAANMIGDYKRAYDKIKEISGKDQSDPHINIQCALLALKNNSPIEALEYFNYTDQAMTTPHLKNCVNYFKHLIYKDLNEQQTSLETQKKISKNSCERILKSLKKDRNIKDIQNILMLDLQFPEPIEF